MNDVTIEPAAGPLHHTVSIPGSKSITNRAIVAAGLARGRSVLTDALFAEDTERMLECAGALGIGVAADELRRQIEIDGGGGHIPHLEASCFCGNSGTTMRFGVAWAASGHGRYHFDGVARMRLRPIGPLVGALRSLGAAVEYVDQEGFPPIVVHAQGLRGGTVVFEQPPSSQFISALLLVAPAAAGDVFIEVRGALPSAPYVSTTLAVLDAFGITAIEDAGPPQRFIVPAPQAYQSRNYAVEPDASNASYFLAAPAVAGGWVTVRGLRPHGIQGDVRFVNVLEQMGCTIERSDEAITVHGPPAGEKLRPVDRDLNDMPDMVQTLAVLALFADGPSVLRNVAGLRLKETDRLAALTTELTRLGAEVIEHVDGLTISPPRTLRPAAISTYDDHRMAMSFALAGLRVRGLVIKDARCVSKTFPDFFDVWGQLSR